MRDAGVGDHDVEPAEALGLAASSASTAAASLTSTANGMRGLADLGGDARRASRLDLGDDDA